METGCRFAADTPLKNREGLGFARASAKTRAVVAMLWGAERRIKNHSCTIIIHMDFACTIKELMETVHMS
jgi:hypothetical protein